MPRRNLVNLAKWGEVIDEPRVADTFYIRSHAASNIMQQNCLYIYISCWCAALFGALNLC